jgi:general secretion pathway protein A
MYKEFYGFKENPFQIVPNPEYLYLSPKHKNALTCLEYALTDNVGYVMLTGEIGSGKTTLIRYLLNQIESDVEVAVIFNTNLTSEQLLSHILQKFDLEAVEGDKLGNLKTLEHFLYRKYEEGKKVLLIIDEAQNLTNEILEEIRMLSNIQSDEWMLLQIVFVGQPELISRIKNPALAQFSQRIAVNHHLQALTREETVKYIDFRLGKAGGDVNLFTSHAMDKIYQASFGIPRTINLLCDAALIYGFADEISRIDVPIVEKVIAELGIVGLYGAKVCEVNTALPAAELKDNNGFFERFELLEESVRKFGLQMDVLIEELEKRGNDYKDELLSTLKNQVLRERELSDKLLVENTRLKVKIKDFMRYYNKKGVPHE